MFRATQTDKITILYKIDGFKSVMDAWRFD
jgi:hypothetical protein